MDEFQIVNTWTPTAYIYALLDPGTREARYVGKSDYPAQRFKSHCCNGPDRLRKHRESNITIPPRDRWVGELAEVGKRPLLAILEVVEGGPEHWGPAEQGWIRKLSKEGHRLLNAQVVNNHKSNPQLLQDALELGRELFDTDL